MARQLINRRTKGAFWGYFFVMPSLLTFLIFSLYPMLNSIVLSFQRLRLTGREWVGLRNYASLLGETAFFTILNNTLLYALLIVPGGVLLSLVMAALIFRMPVTSQTFFKSAFYLPVVTSGVVLSIVWLYLLRPGFWSVEFSDWQNWAKSHTLAG